MQQTFLEKRDFPRMILDSTVAYAAPNQALKHDAVIKELSGNGLLIWVDNALASHTELNVVITPLNPITPPLTAVVEVKRCDPLEDEAKKFALACAVKKFLEPEQN